MCQERGELKGGYFIYCQFCKHDGNCELTHNEFLGLEGNEEIHRQFGVNASFNHEDLSATFSAFQGNSILGTCTGRIALTESSLFFPLACSKCGTVINSLAFQDLTGSCCAKFDPNEFYQKHLVKMMKIAERKRITLNEVDTRYHPKTDESYEAVMEY